MTTVHVKPVADAVAHMTNGDDCPCGPLVEAVFRADGSNGWLVTHHRLARDSSKPDAPGRRVDR